MNNEQGNQTANTQQNNQPFQNGSYKVVVEDGKMTVSPEQSQVNQSKEEQAVAQKLREKIGTKVNDLELLYALDEANIEYKDMELNKKTAKDIKDFVNYIQRLKSERYDRDYIRRQAMAKANEIEERYHSNAKKELNKWTDWQDKVIKRFKEDKLVANSCFEDPQAEILNRQNFNAKLGAMTDNEFTNYINDLTIDDQLSDYELNTLLAKANNNDRLRSKLKQYEHNTRKGYETLPEWNNVQKLASYAKGWTKTGVKYFDNEGHGQVFFPDAIILRELKGYTVSDPSQR